MAHRPDKPGKRVPQPDKPGKRVPRKVWLLLALAVAAGIWSLSSGTGLFGKSERDAFLDAAAADLGKEPRVTVMRVDREAGQIVVRVNATGKKLYLTVGQPESKTLPDGRVFQQLDYTWKDASGNTLASGRGSGMETKWVHVELPPLQ
jgi:hypothetical protein